MLQQLLDDNGRILRGRSEGIQLHRATELADFRDRHHAETADAVLLHVKPDGRAGILIVAELSRRIELVRF